jgi:hypothetical protein
MVGGEMGVTTASTADELVIDPAELLTVTV